MRQNITKIIFSLIVLLVITTVKVFAENNKDYTDIIDTETINNTTSKLRKFENRLKQSQGRVDDLESSLTNIEEEVKDLNKRIILLASDIHASEGLITANEERLFRLEERAKQIGQRLYEKRDRIALFLAGLQRLEQNIPPALIVNSDDTMGALHGAMLLRSVVPALNKETKNLKKDLRTLHETQEETIKEHARLNKNIEIINEQRLKITKLLTTKSVLMKHTTKALTKEQKYASELAKRTRTLSQLIKKLEIAKENAQTVKINAQVEKQNNKKVYAQSEINNTTKNEVNKDTDQNIVAGVSPTAVASRLKLSFSHAKGRLIFPAQGKIVNNYGDKNNFSGKSLGISVATRHNAQILAPYSGVVQFADDFRGYGKLLIIDVGSGYNIILAGMDKLFVGRSQFIRAGEPVGVMQKNNDATLDTNKGRKKSPVLYIELQKKGVAINPAKWWAK